MSQLALPPIPRARASTLSSSVAVAQAHSSIYSTTPTRHEKGPSCSTRHMPSRSHIPGPLQSSTICLTKTINSNDWPIRASAHSGSSRILPASPVPTKYSFAGPRLSRSLPASTFPAGDLAHRTFGTRRAAGGRKPYYVYVESRYFQARRRTSLSRAGCRALAPRRWSRPTSPSRATTGTGPRAQTGV